MRKEGKGKKERRNYYFNAHGVEEEEEEQEEDAGRAIEEYPAAIQSVRRNRPFQSFSITQLV